MSTYLLIAFCIYIALLLLLVYQSEARLHRYEDAIEYHLQQITNRKC